jgi:rfaE bifunctional protein kinase chain/domain
VNRPSQRNFNDKIVNLEALCALIGPRPRELKVIICHGVFDIVHPGHVRHLMYASEKADILVASITCDNHIAKDNFRPFVPEELRSMNLAALEMVDYVIIDPNPTPVETLRRLQPDYYAKGYDYFSDGIQPKTQDELRILESYGGEIIFTPGDVVYSSSRLIIDEPPRIAADKLQVLMDSERITMGDLRQALQSFSEKSVHVIGDTIVDSYTYCTLIGGGSKTPTLSVKYEEQIDYVGGAAIVAKHMRATGANVVFSSVLGDDALAKFVLDDLDRTGIECKIVTDKTRPTIQKNAFVADTYRLLKVDKLDNRPVSQRVLENLKTVLGTAACDGFVFSDFRHGIFSKHSIPELISSLPPGAFKVADSQVASRWGNILEFCDFDLITPNEREARFALGDQDSVIRPLALELYRKSRCKYLILKLGERGSITYRSATTNDYRAFFTVDSFADSVVDAVGTGDALLAYATLGLMTTGSEVVASLLGSMAAGVACEREGNQPISPEDVLEKIGLVEKRMNYG